MAVSVGGALFVDGLECDGHLISAGDKATAKISGVLGVNNGTSTIKPFIFSTLHTTDNDTFLDSAPWDGLGKIVLNIHKVSQRSLSREVEEAEPAPDDQKIHEKFKKGMRHRVKLGKERKCSPLSLCKTWLHPEKLATFTFRYLPLDVLRARGIAPSNSPSSSPSPDKGMKRKVPDGESEMVKKEECDSDDELRSLQKRMDEIIERRAREGPRKKTKTEALALSLPVPGEVIDLT